MRRLELWRSTAFRMAVSFAVLFVLTFVISGFVMYQVMRADLSHSLDETAKETFSVVAATYDGSDLEDLIATVKSHTKLTSPHERLFSLSGPDGSHLAGNFTGMDVPEGYSVIGDIPGVPADGTYRAYSGAVGANRLTVALSYSQTERLEEIVLTGFIWATLIVAALAVAGGAAIASRIQRRLDAIAATMGDVSQGRLGARIPLLGNGDDIDGVSTQVNEALDRLSALVEGMRQVSSDIAHDLKTPLNRLQIILEAAEYGSSNGQDITGQLVEARAESRQINDTFEALLRIAQIEAGARKARFAEVDLDAIVNSIAEIYTDVAEDSGMSLLARRTLQGPGGLVHGDAELLTQMFANLVENALRHCPAGTKIELSVRRDGDRVTASVADDGPGIPPAEHENVFRRLYRIEKSRSTPGSGLGLSLVRAIADLHGATIRLDDRRPGLGVEVIFSASRGGQS
ncbi:HAMP domain-containing sensor histidine kinase [Manganibacter manganicus]|uniref:histidine kinase n=1 Tax=Manganibacter manganicus TaxID=1873176 RepID=A0A1V8RN72_9HYPH|nr:HAMP domain-containing sensor histidine kinase [Pseudaminobacter manganicus]OQM74651.1 two-component sensor histidine kinase [Pseudaminobacter manganicus]